MQQRLLSKRSELHRTVTALWMAGGGGIQRTHCRQAWDDFTRLVKPIVEDLYPEDRHGKADWDVERVRQQIGQLLPEHQRIADAYGVKFQDRRAADRGARRIVEATSEVN